MIHPTPQISSISELPSLQTSAPTPSSHLIKGGTYHNHTGNRDATALIPITLNALRLPRATIALDERGDGAAGRGARPVAVYEGRGGGGAHFLVSLV